MSFNHGQLFRHSSLRIETQPVNEPVTVQDVKGIMRLDSSADDTMIAGLITSAREALEKRTGRSLVNKGYVAYFDRFPQPGQYLRIPMPPLVSVSAVNYLDQEQASQEWDSDEYIVASEQSPALILPKFPNVYPVAFFMPGSVQVHFTSGYLSGGYGDAESPIPERFRLAIQQLAMHWYDHPELVSSDAQNAVPEGLCSLPKVW